MARSKVTLKKITDLIIVAGKKLIEKALILWFCMKDSDTPTRIKVIILGSLVYLVNPVDAIPDMTPVIGYSDDLSVITAVLISYAVYVKPMHKKLARSTLASW